MGKGRTRQEVVPGMWCWGQCGRDGGRGVDETELGEGKQVKGGYDSEPF